MGASVVNKIVSPADHIDRAKEEAAAGDYQAAQVHALIAIAQLLNTKDQS
ncbi:hypothetical protein HWC44_gp090 [Mycobacterium phage ThetaBob]|uniref:Uncharacterized protein n=1 Tax=Mycobacterium phage ThetaBob TaxID=2588513 RepID=A0A4Y6EPD4_9CAUD|nr:hypothetical protein HWC44_gp090 [Mycobacterium phage ThetaBob]QDF19977.1 hypothetical protein SEA_THETABOB_90 [Mycobacterium phage ThetaBob]